MATTEELLQTILQSLEKVEYIKSEDIPNIDLYMDQVLTFMDRKLRSAVRPQTEDRVLTKTMINNYAKNDLLPPPVKKKYSKEHVLMLIFIYYYKGVIPMNEIQTLLQPITDHYFQNGQAFDLESLYKEVVSLEKEQLEDLKKSKRMLWILCLMQYCVFSPGRNVTASSKICVQSMNYCLCPSVLK
jgi:hypothetical protein